MLSAPRRASRVPAEFLPTGPASAAAARMPDAMIPAKSTTRVPFLPFSDPILDTDPGQAPRLPGVGAAMDELIARNEIAGAVTLAVTVDGVVHLEASGHAERASDRSMRADDLFWIASMTKPVTAAAVLMLQDEGRLRISDPVARHLPEFERLTTPSGRRADLSIQQILTHTSGLGEVGGAVMQKARTLEDLVPYWLAAPMQFEPGERWRYNQSGINAAARIVEVVSGLRFDEFLRRRLFGPLGMRDTTFHPDATLRARLAAGYLRRPDTGSLDRVHLRPEYGNPERPPFGHAGLFSTAADVGRFCRMLLGVGAADGRRYLSAESMRLLSRAQTGGMPTGFLQGAEFGDYGTHYGWGLGTCVLLRPHDGVAAMLSPGTFGHGGAWGTQAWVDPVKGIAYVLMIQRANLPNSDGSEARLRFQQAVARAFEAPGLA